MFTMFTVVPEPAVCVEPTGSIQLSEASPVIDGILREGARRMLAKTL
jgi:hypothetical protein